MAGLVMGFGGAAVACAQGGVVSFHFDRAGMDTPHYTFTVGEDGRARYHAELAGPKGGDAAGAGSGAGSVVEKEFALGREVTAKVFELARAAEFFKVVCESKAKNIADTGSKKLTYAGPDGAGECVYNYSDVKPVVALTDIFLRTEATLEAGRRMDFKRRFDRLGLDAEMITLGNLLESKQAAGLEAIVPTLQAIANDTELLARVRTRAEKMLQMADAGR